MAGVPLGFARFRPWYSALRTGAAFNPVDLPDLLAYYDIRQAGTLFQDTAGVTPATAATDPIGRWNAVGPSGAPNLLQGTAPSRPLYQLTPTRAEFDLLDDSLSVTLPAISGGQIVIVSPAGIWIDSIDSFGYELDEETEELVPVGGTFNIGPSTYTGGPSGLLSQLGGDVTAVYILDEPLGVDDQAAMVAFEAARGSAGLITLGAKLNTADSFVGAPISVPGSSVIDATYATGAPVVAGSKYLIDFTVTDYSGTSSVGITGSAFSVSGAIRLVGNGRAFSVEECLTTAASVLLFTREGNTCNYSGISIREAILP